MSTRLEAENRAAQSLFYCDPAEVGEVVIDDLRTLGYHFPLRREVDARDAVTQLSDVVAREKIAQSFIPGSRTMWNIRMSANLAEIAFHQEDYVSAFSSAQFHDSIHPLDRLHGWQRLTDRVVWHGSIAVCSELGIDFELIEVSEERGCEPGNE